MAVAKVADATKVASKVIKLMVQLLVALSFATPAVAERCFKEVGEPFNLVIDVDGDVGEEVSLISY